MPTEPEPTPAPTPTPPPPDPTPPAPPEPDPDEGAKKALNAERTARRDADKRAQALEAELAALKAQSMSDSDRAIAEAIAKATTDTDEKWRDRVIAAEVAAYAAGKVVAPDLVLKLIDKSTLAWDGDQLDKAALGKAIDEIVAQRPYLAPGTPAAPSVPQVPAGPRGTTAPITREQIQKMTPEQVAEAYAKGELKHLTG